MLGYRGGGEVRQKDWTDLDALISRYFPRRKSHTGTVRWFFADLLWALRFPPYRTYENSSVPCRWLVRCWVEMMSDEERVQHVEEVDPSTFDVLRAVDVLFVQICHSAMRNQLCESV